MLVGQHLEGKTCAVGGLTLRKCDHTGVGARGNARVSASIRVRDMVPAHSHLADKILARRQVFSKVYSEAALAPARHLQNDFRPAGCLGSGMRSSMRVCTNGLVVHAALVSTCPVIGTVGRSGC